MRVERKKRTKAKKVATAFLVAVLQSGVSQTQALMSLSFWVPMKSVHFHEHISKGGYHNCFYSSIGPVQNRLFFIIYGGKIGLDLRTT